MRAGHKRRNKIQKYGTGPIRIASEKSKIASLPPNLGNRVGPHVETISFGFLGKRLVSSHKIKKHNCFILKKTKSRTENKEPTNKTTKHTHTHKANKRNQKMNFAKTLPVFLATMLTLAVAANANDDPILRKGDEDFELLQKAAIMSRAVYFHDKFNNSTLSCSKVKSSLGGGTTTCHNFERDLDVMSVIKHDGKCFAVFRETRTPMSN